MYYPLARRETPAGECANLDRRLVPHITGNASESNLASSLFIYIPYK